MKAGDLVTVDSDCGTQGLATIVEQQLFGFVLILFEGSVRLMDKSFLELVNECR